MTEEKGCVSTPSNGRGPGVTFCFLIVRNVVRAELWKEWLDELRHLGLPIRIITHLSGKENEKPELADWLRESVLSESVETKWGKLVGAEILLYKAALATGSQWITLHSETCVPLCSPQAFIKAFNERGDKTQLFYREPWWKCKERTNLHLFPEEHRWGHHQWCILARQDLDEIFNLIKRDPSVESKLVSGEIGDECFVAVCLSLLGRLNDDHVNKCMTTLVDWTEGRSNGDSPFTFNSWREVDREVVASIQRANASLLHAQGRE